MSKQNPLMLLNAPVLTAFGTFQFRPVTLTEAHDLVCALGFRSAIGHAATAAVLSKALGIHCPMNRVMLQQQVGDQVLIVWLNRRTEEGAVITNPEMLEAVGFQFGILTRLHDQ